MSFDLNDVEPWGHNLAEYCAMFDLRDSERQLSILGCGDGPSSFNAEGTAAGMRIVSVDPLYRLRAGDIRERIAATTPGIANELRRQPERYVFSHHPDVDAVVAARLGAMEHFLADYETGIDQGRYVSGSATEMPFHDQCYDLALCSHLLFLYSDQLSLAFHLQALRELTRVADEVRIYPLLDLSGAPSRHLPAVTMAMTRMGLQVERVTVPYELQRGANQMLRIRRA